MVVKIKYYVSAYYSKSSGKITIISMSLLIHLINQSTRRVRCANENCFRLFITLYRYTVKPSCSILCHKVI